MGKHKERKRQEKQKRKKSHRGPSFKSLVIASGRIGNEVGRAGEERVHKACETGEKPSWWKGMRYATLEEDAREIDHVIFTDVGSIYLQTKTFLGEPKEHRPSRTALGVAIIYVNLKESDLEIRKRVVLIVAGERARKIKP